MALDLARLEDVKKDIRCLLVSRNSQNVTLDKLNKIYREVVGEDIPYKDFHFTSLEKFLRSMPDVLSLRYNKSNEFCAYHIDTEKSQHISLLVAREKPVTNSNFKSKFKVYHVNPIDPRLLSEVLQELKNSSLHQKKQNYICKNDVLSAVAKRIGRHTFYTIKDLNSQLNECTHLLTHDDDFIHFKNKLSNDYVTNLKNIKIENFGLKLKEINDQKSKIIDISSASNLIKESTKVRLKNLIEKYSQGIWCSEFPQIYQREYGISLEYKDLGFNSIVEFIDVLPDIFQMVEQLNSEKLILDVKIFKSISENQEVLSLKKYLKNVQIESTVDSIQTFDKYYKAIIPEDVMNFNDTVDQIRVNSLMMDPIENSYHVIISEVHNPSFFWIILYKNKKLITHLMTKLQKFYARENQNYKIPHDIVKPGLHVTCIFEKLWHRGIIKRFKSDGSVVVHFYDYGTSSTFNPDQLYFLNKKFSTVPAQAIPCCLNNVKPLETIWSKKINIIFARKVFDNCFVAYIISTNDKNNSMVVDLVGRNDNRNEIYINQWMIANKLAQQGEFLCQINNVTFMHYQQCWNQNHHKKLNENADKKLIHKNIIKELY